MYQKINGNIKNGKAYAFTESELKILNFALKDKSELKYQELRDKLKLMQEARDPDDNPMVMILHKKN